MRAIDTDKEACGVGIYPGDMWWRAAGYAALRPGIPLVNAGDNATPIAPNAYNYVISLQTRSSKLNHPVDLPADFTALGYRQVQCWTDPYDRRTMLTERTCLWRRPGTCDSRSAKLLTRTPERSLTRSCSPKPRRKKVGAGFSLKSARDQRNITAVRRGRNGKGNLH
jgi:hypothetical protein